VVIDDHDVTGVTAGRDIAGAARRFWWLILLALAIALAIGAVLTPAPGHATSFRATVLIPGDTEDTGSSERPELMVLDDLGPFVGSWVFADAVARQVGSDVTTEQIHGMIEGSRYSRVATVTVTGDDEALVLRVAEAAAEVFPAEVNAFLVAPGDQDASVQVIDPPREPSRDQAMRWVRVGAIGLLGAAAATAIVVLLTPPITNRAR
jgi:hypothetical protein